MSKHISSASDAATATAPHSKKTNFRCAEVQLELDFGRNGSCDFSVTNNFTTSPKRCKINVDSNILRIYFTLLYHSLF